MLCISLLKLYVGTHYENNQIARSKTTGGFAFSCASEDGVLLLLQHRRMESDSALDDVAG